MLIENELPIYYVLSWANSDSGNFVFSFQWMNYAEVVGLRWIFHWKNTQQSSYTHQHEVHQLKQ